MDGWNRHFSKEKIYKWQIGTWNNAEHLGNENQNLSEMPFHMHYDECNKRGKPSNNKCWQGCKGPVALLHFYWGWKWCSCQREQTGSSSKRCQWIFMVDFLKAWLVWSPCCPVNSQECSPAPEFESINSWCSAFFMIQLSHPYVYMDLCRQSDVSAF